MKILGKSLAVLGMFLAGTSLAHAGDWTAGTASAAAGGQVVIPINFAGDGVTLAAQVSVSVAAPLTIVSAAGANGQSCSVNAGTVGVVLFGFGAFPNPSTTYCNVTIDIGGGAAAGNYPVTLTNNLCSISGGTPAPTCTATNGQVTVTGGGVATGPDIAYNPTSGGSAGTGGPVNFTGVTTPGTTGNGTIVATPSGGAAAGTTTVGTFALSGPGAANFTVTSAATLTFTAGTNTPQNITMTCTSTAAQQTANLQATETITNGATTQRFWQLVCPAGAAAAVAPTITYAPNFGTTTNVASSGNFDIAVGCPTDGAACNGSGAGLAATSRLVSVTSAYTGPPFSPTPTMTCNFVNEAGGVVAAPLDFVATQADSGDVRCTCPAVTVAEPFRVTVLEQSPVGAANQTRIFDVVCGAGLTCGTIGAVPASGTINLTNGGAATTVSTVTLTGASAGVTQNVNCVQTNVSAGSTFTVTGVPAALTSAANATTIAATCANTATTTGTATLTCTSTTNSPGCGLLNATYTLSCPGVNVPPVVIDSVPVPALSEQGRILLAALVLLLGLGVVGFRMRG